MSYFGVMLKLFSNYFEFILVTLELHLSHSSVHSELFWFIFNSRWSCFGVM